MNPASTNLTKTTCGVSKHGRKSLSVREERTLAHWLCLRHHLYHWLFRSSIFFKKITQERRVDMKLLKRFINWWIFTPHKSFTKRHPDFPIYFSLVSLLLVMCREEVEWLAHHMLRAMQLLKWW